MIIKEIIVMIIADILTTLYQSFWFALVLSILLMILYSYVYYSADMKNGLKDIFCIWCRHFKTEPFLKKLFFLTFYISMVLFRTLINRKLWPDPLSNVMGGWWIWTTGIDGNQVLTTECFENLILMLPFSLLLLWTMGEKITGEKAGAGKIIWKGLQSAFLFSLTIELLQLLLRLGTFQISDLVYNTLGGGAGGACYYLVRKLLSAKKSHGKHRLYK